MLAQVLVVGALGTGKVPGMFRVSCLRGACCERFRADVAGPFPAEVGYTALYSKTDGVVDWHACLDPAATRSRCAPRTSGWASTRRSTPRSATRSATFARDDGEFWAEAA